MNVTAVIAEYNPFHNGHLYQLNTIRREQEADYIVVVMSGDFMQRGIPAVVNKYERCRMALLNGADLVFELPVYFALGSAEYFAQGAVSLVDKLGIVDFLHFGSESGDIALLCECARMTTHESGAYRQYLRSALKQGASFPAARSSALSKIFPEQNIQDVFHAPNNILGMEYIKALIQRNSAIKPVTLERKGAGYASCSLVPDNFASANAIRNVLYGKSSGLIKKHVPESVNSLLSQDLLCADDFSEILLFKMLQAPGSQNAFEAYYDVGKQLSHTLHNRLTEFTSFDDFALLCKTKNMTYARICRGLMHILLDMTQQNADALKRDDYTQYARLLGFTPHGQKLLKSVKANADIPIITRLPAALKQLSGTALTSIQADIHAADIYELVLQQKILREHGIKIKPRNELTRPFLRLS